MEYCDGGPADNRKNDTMEEQTDDDGGENDNCVTLTKYHPISSYCVDGQRSGQVNCNKNLHLNSLYSKQVNK